MVRVLVVEDDEVLTTVMRRHLEEAGFEVLAAVDGDVALRRVRFERPDAVVLDLMVPGTDGWNLIRAIRESGDTTPILVVSARSAEPDRLAVLENGADDYLVKPASMRELVARLRVLLRRTPAASGPSDTTPIVTVGLLLDPGRQRAWVQTASTGPDNSTWPDAMLTAKEFSLLWTLALLPGRVISREELQMRVWGVPYRPRDRSVDVCVRKVRRKVDERSGAYTYIQTHYGVGYRFEPTPTAA